jgi:hypothetical protein
MRNTVKPSILTEAVMNGLTRNNFAVSVVIRYCTFLTGTLLVSIERRFFIMMRYCL